MTVTKKGYIELVRDLASDLQTVDQKATSMT